ncbi:5-deoxyglucuronate isomerase [Saccharopolyspora erythraea NRRL 2338]|uniref:Myo-inositol catabolism IolB protein n=1 Tax=Saccharopolyspora erythraea (strain ATCC 11635 / DSM 40517 / JCM 4748 / NBRC 13426 / NCIMB 8594 / NRRL 2338) TaxID=405948 RepID=A4FK56_SACEN|nr:5-deoxyglucuronate isomerase [Saccharopolyspora erythraea NRRL 2338]CAM04431.1 myo-inositol catabolism IolB protein [Saccharopolyspora erythraea NRRL 2338]
MTDNAFYRPAGTTARDGYTTYVDPESAGWGYSSLRVLELAAGERHELSTGDSEWIVLPLAGGCEVSCDGETFRLDGRESVFKGVTDFAYVPRDADVAITSAEGGRFALTGAKCENRLPARYGPASGVPVELRGAGQASRQVNNFGAAHVFEADRLIAVEVLTPSGNWSSFPPHKHDTEREGESQLEEIYYFEIAGAEGVGYQRVYPSGPDHTTDVLAEVRGGDVVLIPDGWHGPSMAVPGYDMYYLNVMAGPSPDRAWLICDDPAHAWVRGTWGDQPVDSRLPLYTAPEGDQ